MNILAIGNSFSFDASRYLNAIARADGVSLNFANLFIGGCTLEQHHRNMLSGERAYDLQYNGHPTGFNVSLQEALLNRHWDVITIQQGSHMSFRNDSYEPYIVPLMEYVRQCCPEAHILVHQTWAYEDGSERLFQVAGYPTGAAMFEDVREAYDNAAKLIRAEGIIPSGALLRYLLEHGIAKVHEDTFHASIGLGRYALGLLWYHMITGRSVSQNTFRDFDKPVPEEEIQIAASYIDTLEPILHLQ